MPEVLTRKARRDRQPGGRINLGTVAGFMSEWWPASNRNTGRLHLAIPGRLASESALSSTGAELLLSLSTLLCPRLCQRDLHMFALFARPALV